MRTTKRLLSLAAIAATAVSLTACANSEQDPAQRQGGEGAATSAPSGGASSAPSPSGVTTKDDVFGPACGQVPASGEGSVTGMVDDPVGTAAANNPLLKTLVKAVKAAGLVETLNKQDAQFTVFAPADPAFAKVPPQALRSLLKPSAKQQLSDLLTYHVIGKRLDSDGAARMKELTPVGGGGATLTIGGSGDNMTVTDGSGSTAKVLCGNIPTANATVFVIDTVLMPKQS